MNTDQYTQLIQVIVTIIVPLLIAAEAKWVTKIPSNLKPYVALALGQAGQLVTVWLTQHPFSPIAGLLTGAAGIGLREATITVRDHALTLLAPPAPPASVPASVFTVIGGPSRLSLSTTTTVYGVVNDNFSVANLYAYGTLRARRVR